MVKFSTKVPDYFEDWPVLSGVEDRCENPPTEAGDRAVVYATKNGVLAWLTGGDEATPVRDLVAGHSESLRSNGEGSKGSAADELKVLVEEEKRRKDEKKKKRRQGKEDKREKKRMKKQGEIASVGGEKDKIKGRRKKEKVFVVIDGSASDAEGGKEADRRA